MSHRMLAAVSITTLLLCAGKLCAGPLNPPAGAVGGSMKTLSEVEARTAINAANTPGDADATPSVYKITQPGSYYLTGNVQGSPGKIGIEIALGVLDGSVTIDLNGFELVGGAGSASGAQVTLFGSPRVAVKNGTVRNWGGHGLDLTSGRSVTVEGVRALKNGGNGLNVTGRVDGCVASENAGKGVVLGAGSVAAGCEVVNNGAEGVLTFDNCTVKGCRVTDNVGAGISAAWACAVTDNSVSENNGDGIRMQARGTVERNLVTYALTQGTAAIRVVGGGCHVSDNRVNSAQTGIDVDGTLNVVVRNTVGGTSFPITAVAGNSVGPMVDNPAASTNPHANITP
ncbi:MAG TPA: right-handed parallel beta-helix repeat-containing protein [Phycisphaerales bacterium]|nr:right-handed parallel beta-helix repeat-containing protein [Phycisphaerales bacterium]